MRKELSEMIRNSRVIAIAGGGGKTACMIYLAGLAKSMGKQVLLTTTTHLEFPEDRDYGQDRIAEAGADPTEEPASAQGSITLWFRDRNPRNRRVTGPDPAEITVMAASGGFDNILVEVDGSRMRPLKVPGDSEPVYPGGVDTVIGVIGLNCLGKPADTRTVHRVESFTEVTGVPEGTEITPELLIKLLGSKRSIFKDAPSGARKILVLTHADAFSESEGGSIYLENLAAALIKVPIHTDDKIDTVMTASLNRDPVISHILTR